MPESYPLPAHAASFWIAGDDLWIAFPGQGPEERGHSVKLPATVAGMQTAVNIMKERAQARFLTLGNRGTPTQYELETDNRYRTIAKALGETSARKKAEKADALALLRRIGLA